MNIPLLVVASLFFLVGFWGLLIPVIPDLTLMWLGVLIYALGTRFSDISPITVILLGVLSASSYVIDYLATAIGVKRYGASRQGILGAFVGGAFGLILFPPFGFFFGAILGTVAAEIFLSGRTTPEAWLAGKGALLGLLFGLVAKVAIAGLIIAVFLRSIL